MAIKLQKDDGAVYYAVFFKERWYVVDRRYAENQMKIEVVPEEKPYKIISLVDNNGEEMKSYKIVYVADGVVASAGMIWEITTEEKVMQEAERLASKRGWSIIISDKE